MHMHVYGGSDWLRFYIPLDTTSHFGDALPSHILTSIEKDVHLFPNLNVRVAFSALTRLGGRKGIRPVKIGGWWEVSTG